MSGGLPMASDDGLGEYLLRTYDEVSPSSMSSQAQGKNAGRSRTCGFHAQEKLLKERPFSLKDTKGKSFSSSISGLLGAGPCHALEPLFARVAADFQPNHGRAFFWPPTVTKMSLWSRAIWQRTKPRTPVVFADGPWTGFFTVNFLSRR